MAVASSNSPFILRLVSCSVAAANKAGNIIRNVLQNGDLGVVDKVRHEPFYIIIKIMNKCEVL